MSSPPPLAVRNEQLRRLHELLEEAGLVRLPGLGGEERRVSSGSAAIDRLLPDGGFRRGSLVEWLADSPGGGAGLLALVAAREAHAEGGAVVVIDPAGTFYPPAAAACGLALAGVIVVHPAGEKEAEWALDQSLRCEHAAAVLAWPRRLESHAFRRLQLAAETSGAVGLLVRPMAALREPSWAEVRLAVAPRARPAEGEPSGGAPAENWRLAVRLLRLRGRFGREAEVVVEIDARTGDIHEANPGDLAAELGGATAREQQA